jgi:peptide/nickel transport system permease protein
MVNYIIRRLLVLPIILIGVTMLIFAMIQFLSPEERSALYVRDIPKNQAMMDGIIKRYGLRDPIYLQYWHWLVGRTDTSGIFSGGILRGDLGYSRSGNREISAIIADRFPATIELSLYAVIPIVGIGIWLGIAAAVNHNKLIDQVARVFSIIGYSFPTFIFGLMLLMFFYAQLRWFPIGRLSDWAIAVLRDPSYHQITKLVTIDAILNGRIDILWDAVRHLVLPVVTLSFTSWAVFLRVTRSSMLETLRQDYVVTARAKGMAEHNVVNKHARPNALIPVVTLGGLQVAGLLGGVVFTETIFNYPGIGSAAASAAAQLDVVTVLAFTLLTAFILIVANLVVDVLYGFLDPRVRLS